VRIYYKGDEHYPATYSFKYEEDGAEPTGWITNNGVGCTTTIIESLDGHKKVLQLSDQGAGRCEIYKTFTQGLNIIVEFWLAKSSIAADTNVNLYLYEDATNCVQLRFQDNDLDYYDGGYISIKDNFLVVNTLSHFKLVLNDATNTFDVYVNGVLEDSGLGYRNNTTSGVNKIVMFSDAADTGYKGYIDAIGINTDADYDIGDNLQDWDWLRVSGIIGFPQITTRNNAYGLCSVGIRDFEGALFSDWNPRDLTEMIVTDDSENLAKDCNVLFRGYLMNKKFHAKDLTLEIAGIGILLYRRSFGSEEIKDYVLETGYPKTLNASTQIDLHDDDLANFDWVDEKWIKGNKDVGLIIKDTTEGFTSIYWDCDDPIVQTGGAVQGGTTFADTITFDDANYYEVKDESGAPDLVITATMAGALIPIAKKIKEIQIEYSFRTGAFVQTNVVWNCYLEIKKNGGWEPVDEILFSSSAAGTFGTGWCQALDPTLKEGSSPHIITEGGDSTELTKYFTTNGNYESIELRFWCGGQLPGTSYGKVYVDYLRIKVKYHDEDILPIMYKITDSGNTGAVRWVKCASIPDWTTMGITVDVDAFQIAENTRQIVQDIASKSGLDIEIIDPVETATDNIEPNADVQSEFNNLKTANIIPNEPSGTNDWQKTAATWWESVLDYSDADYIFADDDDDNDVQIIEFSDVTDLTDCSKIVVYLYCKDITGTPNFNVSIDVQNGGPYEADVAVNPNTSYSWKTATFDNLVGVNQVDINAITIRLTAPVIPADKIIYIKGIYVKLFYDSTDDHYPLVTDESDTQYIWVGDGDENKEEEWELTTLYYPFYQATKVELFVKGKYVTTDKNIWVYFDDGDGYSDPVSMSFDNTFGWQSQVWDNLVMDYNGLNACKVKIKAFAAYGAADENHVSQVYVVVTYVPYAFQKYMARVFKGQHCIEPLKAVCNLEGAEWMEDYPNNRIKLVKKANFVDSGVSLTQSNYDHDWEYEDLCNEVKYVYVWGKTTATENVFAKAVSTVANGEDSKQIVDNDILSNTEAQEIANTQLALFEVKRPSIRIPLDGVNAAIQLGTYVNVTMARPTVGAADYKIRMIQRFKRGITGIKTIIYCGFGETDWDEKIQKEIDRLGLETHKSLINKLTS